MPTPPYSKSLPAVGVGGTDIVPVSTGCTIIVIRDVSANPVNDWQIREGLTGDFIPYKAGDKCIILSRLGTSFPPGIAMGNVKASTNTVDFSQEEF